MPFFATPSISEIGHEGEYAIARVKIYAGPWHLMTGLLCVIYAVRGTAHTLFPVDGLCLCMTYPINGRAVSRAKSNRRVRFMV